MWHRRGLDCSALFSLIFFGTGPRVFDLVSFEFRFRACVLSWVEIVDLARGRYLLSNYDIEP